MTTKPLDPEDEELASGGEWWPEALEQRELDNADADCSPVPNFQPRDR